MLSLQIQTPAYPPNINVHFGEKLYRTWADINDKQLFARIDADGKLPTTSAPSPGQFAEVYQALPLAKRLALPIAQLSPPRSLFQGNPSPWWILAN
ncbi:MAG: hypothetical protein B5M51_09565 [Anaerolinea sp. 4484_236]|nr:MAG: hypothetical protein B5M51_09565 [Anaerolinea sp. 4484_236]